MRRVMLTPIFSQARPLTNASGDPSCVTSSVSGAFTPGGSHRTDTFCCLRLNEEALAGP